MSDARGIETLAAALPVAGLAGAATLLCGWTLLAIRRVGGRFGPARSGRVRVRVRRRPALLRGRWLSLFGLTLTLAFPAGAKASRSPFRDATPAQQPWQPADGEPPPPPPAGAEVHPGPARLARPPWRDAPHAAVHGKRHGAIAPLFPRRASEGAQSSTSAGAGNGGRVAPTTGPLAEDLTENLGVRSVRADVSRKAARKATGPGISTSDASDRGTVADVGRGNDVMLPPEAPSDIRDALAGRSVPRFPDEEAARQARRAEKLACMRRHPAGKGIARSDHRLSSSSAPGRGDGEGVHVVRPGESLWSIAAGALDTDDQARIARYWPLIHRANRKVIGSDPNFVYPGQRLILPREVKR